jgi:hypothetical protein
MTGMLGDLGALKMVSSLLSSSSGSELLSMLKGAVPPNKTVLTLAQLVQAFGSSELERESLMSFILTTEIGKKVVELGLPLAVNMGVIDPQKHSALNTSEEIFSALEDISSNIVGAHEATTPTAIIVCPHCDKTHFYMPQILD